MASEPSDAPDERCAPPPADGLGRAAHRRRYCLGACPSAGSPSFISTQPAKRAETLLRVLKRLGYRTAVISGGFSVAAEALQKRLGIDFAWSNTLEIEGGILTGRVTGPIVNAQRKADLLEELARRENVPLDQVIAIGDGANDLLMLRKAGHGIAFHAKPKLREAAHTSISAMGLDAILYLLGITGRDIASLEEQ